MQNINSTLLLRYTKKLVKTEKNSDDQSEEQRQKSEDVHKCTQSRQVINSQNAQQP